MAFCRLAFAVLVLSVVASYGSQVPVFMWGDLGRHSLPHSSVSSVPFNEFGVILKQELDENPLTVVFIEENLSPEDLSSKYDGESSFPYLKSTVGKSLYLAAVQSPLRALNKLADPEKVNHVKLTENGLSADIENVDGKFLFINLKDAKEGETRAELLRRHNDFMEEMITRLQEKNKQIVAIYTAHNPSWTVAEHSRVRRQAESATNDTSVTNLVLEGLLIRFGTVRLTTGTEDVLLKGATGGGTVLNNTEMYSTIQFNDNNKVTLNFVSEMGYWMLNTATLSRGNPPVQEDLRVKEDVNALLGFSYVCSVNITMATYNESTNYVLTFQNVKLQPFFNNNTTGLQYGDSFNCVGFFTAPIWAGLFVVSLLLAIMFYGIMMMMDIRTMDRFDDPKGKTITINAQEG